MSLTQTIKIEARRLGFSLAAVTTPDPPPHWPTYEHWLLLGRHGSMEYLTDLRRADPHRVLSECQSILVLATRYPNPGPREQSKSPRPEGRVASYAWGRDYHLVIPVRLEMLVTFIEMQIGKKFAHRLYTDTGPILERDLAQRAGMGWIGKNTCLIHPGLGSYFLLAEILLGIELEPDAPFKVDRCGTCTRCVTACPTGCILPDRTIDARLCLSYLTIENKQEIPVDLRHQTENWIFGCDICQQVCPWNRFAISDHDPSFNARPGIPNPDLVAELALTQNEFSNKFSDSPIKRSKWKGYLRNIAVALGNSGDPAALKALQSAVQSNEPGIREHALWAINNIETNSHIRE
ncbi:MAG: tRNA epoxyqueuosine(34) reductase QueG [Anaerolineales bacterium]